MYKRIDSLKINEPAKSLEIRNEEKPVENILAATAEIKVATNEESYIGNEVAEVFMESTNNDDAIKSIPDSETTVIKQLNVVKEEVEKVTLPDQQIISPALNALTMLTCLRSFLVFGYGSWICINPERSELGMMLLNLGDNYTLALILGTINVTFCFYGAYLMRKLYKRGYKYYLIGELLPFLLLVQILFRYAMPILNRMILIYTVAILVFILAYATQKKYLTR